jgi:hypothetical protein
MIDSAWTTSSSQKTAVSIIDATGLRSSAGDGTAPPKRYESLQWIFDPRSQHNGFRCKFRADDIFDFSGQII